MPVKKIINSNTPDITQVEIPFSNKDSSKRSVLSVSEITGIIKGKLETEFYNIWVEGEISNCKISQAGHAYFSLKDESSILSCVMFRGAISKIKFKLEDGIQVILHGNISVYEARGQYQLVVDTLEIAGLGALQQAFEQLKVKLKQEGLFDVSHKRPLPLLPQRIGIVTSPTGAAIRDILNILNRRYINMDIIIAPALVQGDQAGPQIAEGIKNLNKLNDIDVIIVTRGGGSLEDLWPFNEEIVARAVYHSKIPVISAVGHEIDFTICDFVADLRAPTPSAAAELVVKDKESLEKTIQGHYEDILALTKNQVEQYRSKLDDLISSTIFTQPTRSLESHTQMVDDYYDRLERHIFHSIEFHSTNIKSLENRLKISSPKNKLKQWQEKIENIESTLTNTINRLISVTRQVLILRINNLNALSPLAVLGRGYSITFRLPDKTIVRDIQQVQNGDKIDIHLHRGKILAEVIHRENSNDGNKEESEV